MGRSVVVETVKSVPRYFAKQNFVSCDSVVLFAMFLPRCAINRCVLRNACFVCINMQGFVRHGVSDHRRLLAQSVILFFFFFSYIQAHRYKQLCFTLRHLHLHITIVFVFICLIFFIIIIHLLDPMSSVTCVDRHTSRASVTNTSSPIMFLFWACRKKFSIVCWMAYTAQNFSHNVTLNNTT